MRPNRIGVAAGDQADGRYWDVGDSAGGNPDRGSGTTLGGHGGGRDSGISLPQLAQATDNDTTVIALLAPAGQAAGRIRRPSDQGPDQDKQVPFESEASLDGQEKGAER